uniref:Uncharacterized protein n=1 Tax=Vespula pensylvanica TaxID=30213 RepID=A0A834PF93_VESPE|nr:hypothetical protein H0235_001187 [Vespula pensylvanica]
MTMVVVTAAAPPSSVRDANGVLPTRSTPAFEFRAGTRDDSNVDDDDDDHGDDDGVVAENHTRTYVGYADASVFSNVEGDIDGGENERDAECDQYGGCYTEEKITTNGEAKNRGKIVTCAIIISVEQYRANVQRDKESTTH